MTLPPNSSGLPPARLPATAVLDYEDARRRMVDGQIRPNRVTDPVIVEAMRQLPRERFLPAGRAHLAYIDEDVPLGNGRYLIEPMVIARLLKIAAPRAGERALVVASGTGYGAALLADCGLDVIALEDDPALSDIARVACETARAGRIRHVSGPLAAGWAAGAPYDLVMIEGAVHEIPPAIAAQLAPTGRLVTVLATEGIGRQAVLAEPSLGALRSQPMFDCGTPFIPALLPRPAFVF
jgi:protein-L-isoaspartate(D-aspartate) O-methyltransferase